MRGLRAAVRRLAPRLRRLDALAAALLALYAALALSTELGANVAGQGLDPVWAEARQRGTLRVAIDLGFYPFTWVDEAGQPAGYDVDLARAVAQRLDLGVEFVPSGLDAIYDDLAARRADMAASALPYAPEQSWRASFSSFYFNAGQVLVAPAGSPIDGEDKLAGRTVAVPLGSDADTHARRLMAAGTPLTLRAEYDTPEEALDAVLRGEADAAIVDNASALMALGRRPGLSIAAALTLEPYVLAFAPEAFELRERANRALEDLRREGFFDELGHKWFVEAEPPAQNTSRESTP
ncbi:MAG: ABC transporter substrate-binding protein [Chloroflexota bacterium]